MKQIQEISVSQIEVGKHDQRATGEDLELNELAASIRSIGVLVPLILEKEGDTFHLVSGHRRILAAIRVGLSTVPCIVQDSDKVRSTETAFAENFFRKDLSPVELASAIRECIDAEIMSIEELAKGLHRSQQWIRAQALMITWPPEILQAIHLKQISVSAASNLALITDNQYRGFLLHNAIENGATARATAGWLQSWQLSRSPEEAMSQVPVDGVIPAVAVIPQAPCLFCANVFRTDALNYMGVCPRCLADFQQARERRLAEEQRS